MTGLTTQLYYINQGKVNDYALGFQVPVPANISTLHFNWQSLAPSTPVSISGPVCPLFLQKQQVHCYIFHFSLIPTTTMMSQELICCHCLIDLCVLFGHRNSILLSMQTRHTVTYYQCAPCVQIVSAWGPSERNYKICQFAYSMTEYGCTHMKTC